MKAHFTMNTMVRITTLFLLILINSCSEHKQGEDATMAAIRGYKYVQESSGSLKYPSPEQIEALDTIRKKPEAILEPLAGDLAQATDSPSEDRYRTVDIFQAFLSPNQQLAVARMVVLRTKNVLPEVLAVLALRGEVSELMPVIDGIDRAPDGDGIDLARILVSRSDLPEFIELLENLASKTPGTWSDAVDLQLGQPIGTLSQAARLRESDVISTGSDKDQKPDEERP